MINITNFLNIMPYYAGKGAEQLFCHALTHNTVNILACGYYLLLLAAS